MRIAQRHLALTACAVLLVGCTTTNSSDEPTSTAEPTAGAPSATATALSAATVDPTRSSSAPSEPNTDSAGSPDSTESPTENPTSTDGAGTGAVPADLAPDALLPDAAYDPIIGERVEQDGVVAWSVPTGCVAEAPAAATAMRTVTVGSGEVEAPIGVQQVAVFGDADAAVAESDRLLAALSACAATDGSQTAYLPEPLAVGAQGLGLATDYYGASADGSGDDALGSYLAVTRRGTALTLVSNDGGESTIGAARSEVTERAQAAWELLCGYDSAGC